VGGGVAGRTVLPSQQDQVPGARHIVILGLMIMLAAHVIGVAGVCELADSEASAPGNVQFVRPSACQNARVPGIRDASQPVPPWEFGPGDLMRRVGRGGGLP
jgi:hypothetical protein